MSCGREEINKKLFDSFQPVTDQLNELIRLTQNDKVEVTCESIHRVLYKLVEVERSKALADKLTQGLLNVVEKAKKSYAEQLELMTYFEKSMNPYLYTIEHFRVFKKTIKEYNIYLQKTLH